MKNFLILSLFLLALASCKSEKDAEMKADLIGQWRGAQWFVFDKLATDRNPKEVIFSFLSDDTYSATFSKQEERGTFKIKSDKLYTHADGQIEKMVKILKLTPDTLVFQMNRVGQEEKLVLVKE